MRLFSHPGKQGFQSKRGADSIAVWFKVPGYKEFLAGFNYSGDFLEGLFVLIHVLPAVYFDLRFLGFTALRRVFLGAGAGVSGSASCSLMCSKSSNIFVAFS